MFNTTVCSRVGCSTLARAQGTRLENAEFGSRSDAIRAKLWRAAHQGLRAFRLNHCRARQYHRRRLSRTAAPTQSSAADSARRLAGLGFRTGTWRCSLHNSTWMHGSTRSPWYFDVRARVISPLHCWRLSLVLKPSCQNRPTTELARIDSELFRCPRSGSMLC